MARHKIRNTRRNKRKFSNSANKTKAININPNIYRGGIRL